MFTFTLSEIGVRPGSGSHFRHRFTSGLAVGSQFRFRPALPPESAQRPLPGILTLTCSTCTVALEIEFTFHVLPPSASARPHSRDGSARRLNTFSLSQDTGRCWLSGLRSAARSGRLPKPDTALPQFTLRGPATRACSNPIPQAPRVSARRQLPGGGAKREDQPRPRVSRGTTGAPIPSLSPGGRSTRHGRGGVFQFPFSCSACLVVDDDVQRLRRSLMCGLMIAWVDIK